MKTAFLDALRDSIRPIWSVYVLINHTKKQIYFGVSKRTFDRIAKEHSTGKTEALKEWDWECDDIEGDA